MQIKMGGDLAGITTETFSLLILSEQADMFVDWAIPLTIQPDQDRQQVK